MKLLRKSIEAIVLFDLEGNPMPIRFRYLSDSEEIMVIKIGKIIKRELEKFAGNKMFCYTCEGNISNELKVFEIRFEVDTCKWYLYKL